MLSTYYAHASLIYAHARILVLIWFQFGFSLVSVWFQFGFSLVFYRTKSDPSDISDPSLWMINKGTKGNSQRTYKENLL